MANIIKEVPEEFYKVINDFVSDIIVTFPEYEGIINKWWKPNTYKDIEDLEERLRLVKENYDETFKYLFKHSLTVYPERFFDILYKNDEMFKEDSTLNTEFLPGISFKYLWHLDITDKTRETIWKYLQLISISVIGCVHSKEAFGNTAKLFENIDEEDFKGKLQETLEQMQNLFETGLGEDDCPDGVPLDSETNNKGTNIPSADDIHSHINTMLSGKLGDLAKEIAEETANDLNINTDDITDVKDIFQNIFKNPGKLMGMVKNVGDKLDSKIKSGDIKESELIAEASEIMNKMKNMPGMGDIQGMLSKMGLGGFGGGMGGGKMNMNAMQSQLQRNMKMARMKERMKSKVSIPTQNVNVDSGINSSSQPTLSDEQLISVFSTGEKVEKTPVNAKPNKKGKSGKKK
jgi:hypothetical protein